MNLTPVFNIRHKFATEHDEKYLICLLAARVVCSLNVLENACVCHRVLMVAL